MDEPKKQYFCPKPFEWFEVGGDGQVSLCCSAWLPKKVGNVGQQSLDEVWNSQDAQEIRASILDGSFRYCDKNLCPHLQTGSGPVKPVSRITDPRYKEIIEKNQTVLNYGPQRINCCYDATCNLSCPSCRKAVFSISKAGRQVTANFKNKSRVMDYFLAFPYKLQDKILEKIDDVEWLAITGTGDPFASEVFQHLLQNLDHKKTPHLKIRLHTNATLWTPAAWEKMKDIHPAIVSTEVSIDAATAETYAVNRRGGDFEKLMRNLKFVSQLRQSGPLEYFKISFVVQENNFEEMPAFVELGESLAADEVYFSRLSNWGTFTDEEFKARCVHREDHSRHQEFLDVISRPIFDDPRVSLGNLTKLIPAESTAQNASSRSISRGAFFE